jgi:SAM-dependent methyltransferase
VNALYDTIGKGYADYRKPDPRIAAMIEGALGDADTVLNVGAGTGSYELPGRHVGAVEPSAAMIAQRLPTLAGATQASAEAIPFPDKSFDAATAFLTTHHWSDRLKGLREMRRVARKRCVFLTWQPGAASFWLTEDYVPEILHHEEGLFSLDVFEEVFPGFETRVVPIPHDCTDGFLGAYWCRPEAYLDPLVRRSISGFSRIGDAGAAALTRLRADLDNGNWMRRHGHLMQQTTMDCGYRLIVAEVG